jgi:RsmE family RNA methyltransferase
MNLILLEKQELDQINNVTLDDRRAEHIIMVLKANVKDVLRVGQIDGPIGQAEIIKIENNQVSLSCQFDRPMPPKSKLDILLALPRPKVLRRVIAPLATIGVNHIFLTNAWKVRRNYFDTHWLNPVSQRILLLEGLEQAQDTRLPKITIHKRLRLLVENELDKFIPNGLRLVAQPGAQKRLKEIVSPKNERVILAIGPEGGWIPAEVDLLIRHKFIPISLGSRILRSDTACIAISSIIHELLEE